MAKSASIFAKFKGGQSRKAKTARGAIWLTIGGGGEQGLRLVRTMILTRLLSREDFGVMSLVMTINLWFEAFTEFGIRLAIIQNPEGEKRTFLNGAWFLSVSRSVVLYLTAFLTAPYIGQFYGDEIVGPLRVAFLSILFNGAQSPLAYIQTKNLKYGRWAVIQNGGGIVGILVAIGLGFVRMDVWALVIGFTAESGARCVLSYLLCPFLPTLDFDKRHLREVLTYAKGILGLGFLSFAYQRIDILVLGKLVDKSTLGLYQVSLIYAQMPYLLYSTVIGTLLFPSFSSLQDDHLRLRSAVLKCTSILGFIFLPALTLMACMARPIMDLLAGENYSEAAVPFAVLCVAVGVQVFGQLLGEVCFATGRPDLVRRIAVLRFVVAVILIVPMIQKFGLVGSAGTRAIVSAIWVFSTLCFLRNRIGLSTRSYLGSLVPSTIVCILIIGVWLIASGLF
jgi:O-antigen/teichoic acid export membrane protein